MKGYLLRLWSFFDPFYFKCTRLCYVFDQTERRTVFRVRITRYKGKPVVLNDGTRINKNDLLLKIHLHNAQLLQDLTTIKSEMKRAVYVYHQIKQDMPELAKFMQLHQQCAHLKGIIGITSLYRGADRLGFNIVPIKSHFYRMFKQGAFLFINLFTVNTKKQKPVYLFMSKEQLFSKYL